MKKNKTIVFKVTKEMKKDLMQLSKEKGISLSEYVREIIQEECNNKFKK
jgi:predicted DNA-binding protein